MAQDKDDHIDDPNLKNKPKAGDAAAVEEAKLNFVEVLAGVADASSGKTKRDKKARGPDRNSVQGASQDESVSSRRSRVPDSVQERFIQIGNNFYFPGGAEAFRRESNRLTTRSENAVVIQSMVAIARAESETGSVKVGGSDFFRKEAWFAARLAGLEVQGYAPTEFERERLVRAVAARSGPRSPDEAPEAEKVRLPNSSELIAGRLVDHGPAPYQHNPKATMSYFVRIETDKGDRDIWGVDLERAFSRSLSNPGIGDEIGIRAVGKEPVTVLTEGRELDTHRNQWSVERKEFLDQRRDMAAVFRDATISAEEGTRQHSGLEGSYRTLEMGESHAKEQYSSKAHRAQFLDHLRDYIAKAIEYGQPLEPTRSRTREERTPHPREPDRDYHPIR
jgi:hypothetical protein